MVALNHVTITGNLTRDPELRFTNNGTAVANFSIASTKRTFNRDTEQWEDGGTLFLDCTVWGQQAENTVESVAKGDRVTVTGSLEQNDWEDDEGNKRSKVTLTADDIAVSTLFATVVVKKNQRREPEKAPDKKTPARKTATSRR
jgi:single-strand DNA-binding protein